MKEISQPTFASLQYVNKKKTTRREKFLGEMDQVVPWARLVKIVKPHYPKGEQGRPPMELETMLRIYFLQQWFNLSDPAMEDTLYDMESMRRFAGIELGVEEVPDETTILHFRHLLERHGLTEKIFAKVNHHLHERGLLMRHGTIVDATIIAAPSSTKNEEKQRDPEMSSTKKGGQWYFGMKLHIGVDAESGLVHAAKVTTAKVHDSQAMGDLLHFEEQEVYGDKAYADEELRRAYQKNGVEWNILRKAERGERLTESDRAWNRRQSKIRARVEHVFHVIKNLWGHRKVRYRGLAKNEAQCFSLLALANLYKARKFLLPVVAH
jgi:IS5 family transposase